MICSTIPPSSAPSFVLFQQLALAHYQKLQWGLASVSLRALLESALVTSYHSGIDARTSRRNRLFGISQGLQLFVAQHLQFLGLIAFAIN